MGAVLARCSCAARPPRPPSATSTPTSSSTRTRPTSASASRRRMADPVRPGGAGRPPRPALHRLRGAGMRRASSSTATATCTCESTTPARRRSPFAPSRPGSTPCARSSRRCCARTRSAGTGCTPARRCDPGAARESGRRRRPTTASASGLFWSGSPSPILVARLWPRRPPR